jgi:hypothetical protein
MAAGPAATSDGSDAVTPVAAGVVTALVTKLAPAGMANAVAAAPRAHNTPTRSAKKLLQRLRCSLALWGGRGICVSKVSTAEGRACSSSSGGH